MKINYDKFFNNPNKVKFENVNVNIADNPSINKNLLDRIINTGTMNNYTDQQLFDLLNGNLRGFLVNIFERKDQRYIKLIISDRFLRILIQVVNMNNIDYTDSIYLNKLCYDYMTLDDKFKNTVISDLIYQLAKITNKKYIPILIGRGIPEKIACYIVLSRFSSNDEFLNVIRMNLVIMTANISFNEQMIVDVYQVLFKRVTMLFEATMLDVVDENEEWYTEEINERNSLISLAVLDILNSLTSEQIRRVLDDYAKIYHIKYAGKPVRFDVRCLSSDYIRIRNIAEQMSMEGIRLP